MAIHLLLFLATIATTLYCGAEMFGGFFSGVLFSATIMTMVTVHEMGHFYNARRHGADVTPPYFIPVPFGIGTMGAFIRMRSSIQDRNVLMDIGAAGPLWGFGVALVATYLGFEFSTLSASKPVSALGTSLLFSGMSYLITGVSPEYVNLNPVLFAGWLGLFVTMLNLLPLGQADGGHVVYAIFGKSRNYRRRITMFSMVFLMWGVFSFVSYGNLTWLLFWFLICYLGGGAVHPPLDDEMEDLTPINRLKGWACILIFVLTFTPVPTFG